MDNPCFNPAFPSRVWHPGPQQYSDMMEIIVKHGIDMPGETTRADNAAREIAKRFQLELYTNYTLQVHFDWNC